MKENKIKICLRCQKQIFSYENYIHIEEYNESVCNKESFWHKTCFEDKNFIKKLAAGLVERTHRIMDKFEGGRPEEVLIR